MKIFKDIITDSELFTDALETVLRESECGSYYIFEGKMTTQKSGDIDGALIGANASQEETQEEMDETTQKDFDFVINSRLQKGAYYSQDKAAFKAYLKSYFGKVIAKVSEKNPDCLAKCKQDAVAFSKMLLSKYDNLEFFFGENDSENEGTCCILEWNEDGMSGKVYTFKAALKEEKV